jgi:hypothetical protein
MPLKRRFAEGTTVTAAKSQASCRNLIERHGGDLFSTGWRSETTEFIGYRWKGRFYRFDIQHPPKEREAQPPPAKDLSDPRDIELRQRYETSYSLHWNQLCEKEVMRRWRVLHTLILEPLFKLALEEEGDDAMKVFMAYALLPDGSTVGETMEPQLTIAYETGAMPALGSGL